MTSTTSYIIMTLQDSIQELVYSRVGHQGWILLGLNCPPTSNALIGMKFTAGSEAGLEFVLLGDMPAPPAELIFRSMGRLASLVN